MNDKDWQSLLREASRLHSAGRAEDAIIAYQRLLAVNPDLPDSWFNLAWLQRQNRDYRAALQSYQRALDLNVARPEEVHLNRAAIFSEGLRLPAEAEAELVAAIGRKGDYLPALLNLGNLREDLGDRDGAREAYRQVLQTDPGNALALARTATLSLSADLDEQLAGKLRRAIADRAAAGKDRAGLGFALAALLDAAGQYEDAFSAAKAANSASRASAGRAGEYDRAATEDFVRRSVRAFDHADRTFDSAASPVFICGMFRSGSTLAEQILAGHSQVAASGELDLIPALAARIADYPDAVASADSATVETWRQFYLDGLPTKPKAGLAVTDKRPDNFLHLGLIKTLFPQAKIIHTSRDPLDNLLSLYFLHLDPRMSYALDLDDSAHWYRQYRELMDHWSSLYADDMLTVNYDRLVRHPTEAVREMLEFVGLEWEDSCLDFNRSGEMVRTASVWQVREPLYQRSSGRWRNYAGQLEHLRQTLAEQRT